MTDNITALRPKAKDPTNALRQARFRSKRKNVVTPPAAIGAPPVPPQAPVTVAHPTPPPQRGRDVPVVAQRNRAGIDVAAYTAAVALAGAAAWFSVKGMVTLFPGAPLAIITMAVTMEGAKLVTAGWLARRWRSTALLWRLILVALVAGLALINAAGVYAQLVAAHVGLRGEAASAQPLRAAPPSPAF